MIRLPSRESVGEIRDPIPQIELIAVRVKGYWVSVVHKMHIPSGTVLPATKLIRVKQVGLYLQVDCFRKNRTCP